MYPISHTKSSNSNEHRSRDVRCEGYIESADIAIP